MKWTMVSYAWVFFGSLWWGCQNQDSRPLPGHPTAAKTGQGANPPPYDIQPLLAEVRSAYHKVLATELGLSQLTDLPYYDLSLVLDPEQGRVQGRLWLHYLNRSGHPKRILPLLLHPNAPLELGSSGATSRLELTTVRALVGPKVTMKKRRLTLVELHFAEAVQPGQRIKLEVLFTATLRQLPPGSNDIFSQALSSLGMASSGAGASDYGLLAYGDGIYTLASAFPVVAPYREGTFDVNRPSKFGDLAYGELSNFKVKVTVPQGYTVVTNLREQLSEVREQLSEVREQLPEVREQLPDKKAPHRVKVVTALGAANRDLVIVAGKDLKQLRDTLGEVQITSTFHSPDTKMGQLVLETAKESLALYEQRFGPYPYHSLDLAEATLVGGAGGVEFPGMVLIAGMFYHPPSKSTNIMAQLVRLMGGVSGLLQNALGGQDKGGASGFQDMDQLIQDMAVFVVAHEVAHQYFAGLVGSDCRAHPAVDEPLAQFAAGEYIKKKYGEDRGTRLMDSNVKLNYGIYRMLGGADQAAARPVQAFPSALAYAAIVYGKAPYFYVTLRERLGAARFDQALLHAVTQSRFRIISFSQWIDLLEQGARGGVRTLARRWFAERHGDEDLQIDDSGQHVLAVLMGQQAGQQLEQNLAVLGLKPRELFRMLMGNLLAGEDGNKEPPPSEGDPVSKPVEVIQQLLGR